MGLLELTQPLKDKGGVHPARVANNREPKQLQIGAKVFLTVTKKA